MTVTLSVDSGTLAATTGGSVMVTGTGTSSIVLSGSLANLNTYLASVSRPVFFKLSSTKPRSAATV